MATEEDIYYMRLAIEQAELAAEKNEAPVGAVVVCDGEVVGAGHNLRESEKNALCHAEIAAIDQACRRLHGWRLHKCTMYVTLEPCPMCAGAIINSRIKRVVFGAHDSKAGSFGSVIDLNSYPFNHKPETVGGVLGQECSKLLSDFFLTLRKKDAGEINKP